MARTIDADDLHMEVWKAARALMEVTMDEKTKRCFALCLRLIRNAPTIEPQPAQAAEPVRGFWIPNTDDFSPAYRCSACKSNFIAIASDTIPTHQAKFCPECGADMRGDA